MADNEFQERPTNSRRRQRRRLFEAFAQEERRGLLFVLYARFLVLLILLVWAVTTARGEYALVYAGILIVFAALGALPLIMHWKGIFKPKWVAGFFTLDALLLTYVLMVPGSMFPSTLTPQFNLQLPSFLYLCLFVVGMAISYSPLLVLWIGFVAICAWSAGMVWIVGLPDSIAYTFSQLLDSSQFTDEARVEITSSRLFVSLTHWYNRILFLGLVTLILAAVVWRSRRLVERQITSEAARQNLSRYFSPNMVDRLSSGDATLDQTSTRKVAIIFVDIVGFTEIAERLGPQNVIELLRSFHSRMARTVFAHGGTIDKYIGDALMANFGTPEVGPNDASNALRCAFSMIEGLEQWNGERRELDMEPIEIGIGIHYGEVVTGNIGDENHLEFAVLGDTVNLASRLEKLTRKFRCKMVVSSDLVSKIRTENDDDGRLLKSLVEERTTVVRGRSQPVSVWRLARTCDDNPL